MAGAGRGRRGGWWLTRQSGDESAAMSVAGWLSSRFGDERESRPGTGRKELVQNSRRN